MTTIAIDFDGVIHRYSRGWQGGDIYDPPMPGVEDALRELGALRGYKLVVFTVRDDLSAVWGWLETHALHHYVADVTNAKPIAVLYIDDRGYRFGDWPTTLRDTRDLLVAQNA